MTDLEVQRRIDSESLSIAFEQNLRKEEEAPLPENGRGSAGEPKPYGLQSSTYGFRQDPLLAQEDDADSWLVPSPGPRTERGFDMSPPKTRISVPKASQPHAVEDAQTEKDSTSKVHKSPDSPTKKASKIPRVAQLAGIKNSTNPIAKNVKATAVASRNLGKAGNTKEAIKALRPGRNSTQPQPPTKKDLFDGTIDAKREDCSTSKIPSRPGSAASTRSVLNPTKSSASKISPPRSSAAKSPANTTPAAKVVGKGSVKSPVPAASRPGNKANGVKGALSKGQKNGGTKPVPLLTAISGPEEEFAAAVENEDMSTPEDEMQQSSPEPASNVEINGGLKKAVSVQSQSQEETSTADLAEEKQAAAVPVKSARRTGAESARSSRSGAAISRGNSGIPKPGLTSARSIGSKSEAARSSKNTTPRPDWIDASADDAKSSELGKEGRNQQESCAEGHKVPKVPSTPFKDSDDPADNAPTDRPGVGRHKADVLPDKGYSKPHKAKKSCFGCAVM